MSNISFLRQIDHVLNIFKEHQSYLTYNNVRDKVNETDLKIEGSVLIMIIEKLHRDKLIFLSEALGHPSYMISFEGNLSDGYEAKFLADSAYAEQQQLEINRLRTLDVHSENNQNRLNSLTMWLAIGTGALALIEIIKFVVWIFSPQTKP